MFFELKFKKKVGFKTLLIALILVEGFFPYLKTGNFNDDTFSRPKFHGGYEIGDNDLGLKRLFVHRHGYLIFQNEKDEFQDFQLEVDSLNQQLQLFDYRTKQQIILHFKFDNDKITRIKGEIESRSINLDLTKIDYSDSELLKSDFNWVIK